MLWVADRNWCNGEPELRFNTIPSNDIMQVLITKADIVPLWHIDQTPFAFLTKTMMLRGQGDIWTIENSTRDAIAMRRSSKLRLMMLHHSVIRWANHVVWARV